MGIYLITIGVVSAIGGITFYNGSNKNKKKVFLCLSGIVMFFLMAFRAKSVGTDTSLYCTVFRNIANSKDIFSVSEASTLYAIYNKIIYWIFGMKDQWIIICNSMVIIILVCIFIYKNSDNVVMSMLYFMLFYHYFQAFNISRQYISVLLIANSFYFINSKNIKAFLLLEIIATLIHNTAIIFFPIGLILFFDLNIKKIMRISSILMVIMYFYDSIINMFLNIFPRYSMYFKGSALFYNTGEGKRIWITVLYLLIVILGIILFKPKEELKDNIDENKVIQNEKRNWYNLLFIMIVAVICGIISMKSILISRVEWYFSIFAIIFIPYFLERFKKQKYLIYAISIFVLMIPTYVLLKSNSGGIVPYIVFWNS